MLTRRVVFFVLFLLTASSLAWGQQPQRAPEPATSAWGEASLTSEPARPTELQSIYQRLDALETENARLRGLIETPSASPPPSTSHVLPAGYENQDAGDLCADCGKSTTQLSAHLCSFGSEKLGFGGGNWQGDWKVVPFGRLRGDLIYSSAKYANDAVIVFLNPNNLGVDEDSTSVTAKQSQINFAISGPNHNGFETGGLVIINFMGAQPLRNFSGANIVNAYGEFKDDRWRFAFGRMLDLFGPNSPTAVNQLQQRGAGNIGIYRGAFNVDRYVTLSDVQRWTISSRISQPDISDYAAIPAINGQNNGWPNIEARVGVELGPQCGFGRPLEVGVSGVIGEIQAVLPAAISGGLFFPGIDEVEQTRGVCLDFKIQGETFGVRGEAWWGQAAGTYFVATLQTINPETDQAIEAVGGWCEAYYNLSPCLTTHAGYGVDDPRNADLGMLEPDGPGQISFNDVAWWNLLYDVTDYFEIGCEVSHRRTRYADTRRNNDGTLFHFSSTFKF